MRRGAIGIALLSLMAMNPNLQATPHIPGWWRKMCRELADIGAYVKGAIPAEDEECDVEFACPSGKVEEARAIVAKYMTKEAREAEAKAQAELEKAGGQ